MNEQLKTLFEGSDLSQDFKDKVTAIIEASIEEQVEAAREDIAKEYETTNEEYKKYLVEDMKEKVDAYITEEVVPSVERNFKFAVQEFVKENQLVAESATKVKLAESFLKGIVGLTEEFNVKVPEGQDSYVAEMEKNVAKMNERFDTLLKEKQALENQIIEAAKKEIISTKVKELTESEKERFHRVCEKIKFDNAEQYDAAVEDMFESYFPAKETTTKVDESKTEDVKPVNESKTQDSSLAALLKMI